jgi:hypothetical protein
MSYNRIAHSFILAAVIFSGCCIPPKTAIVVTPRGERLCGTHRVVLVTVRGYTAPDVEFCFPSEHLVRMTRCYPNALGVYRSLRPDYLHTKKTLITYCPQCEAEFQRQLKSTVAEPHALSPL